MRIDAELRESLAGLLMDLNCTQGELASMLDKALIVADLREQLDFEREEARLSGRRSGQWRSSELPRGA